MNFPATTELFVFIGCVILFFIGIKILSLAGPSMRAVTVRIFSKFSFPRNLVSPELQVLPPLRRIDSRSAFYRFKFTLFILFLNVYTFIFTIDMNNSEIAAQELESRGFSYQHFAEHKWFILVTSNFLHFQWEHLTINMIMLLCFSGMLELLKGSRFAAWVYLLAMNSNVPNGLILLPVLRVLSPEVWSQTVSYIDVGASLGIMGSLGGLARLLIPKVRFALIGLAVLGAFVGSIYIHNLFGIDHAFSVLIGYLTAAYLLKNSSHSAEENFSHE